MIFWILIVVIVIVLLAKRNKKDQKTSSKTIPKLNIDNDDFLIEDGCLHRYRGNSNVVIVPEGVTAIYAWESAEDPPVLCKKKRVVLPRSLYYIGSDGIWCVEEICYKGTKAEWEKIKVKNQPEHGEVGICDSWREVAGGPLIQTKYYYNWQK